MPGALDLEVSFEWFAKMLEPLPSRVLCKRLSFSWSMLKADILDINGVDGECTSFAPRLQTSQKHASDSDADEPHFQAFVRPVRRHRCALEDGEASDEEGADSGGDSTSSETTTSGAWALYRCGS